MNKSNYTLYQKFLSLFYKKEKKGNSICVVEKHKILKVTILKRITSSEEIRSTYFKFFNFTKPISNQDSNYNLDENSFETFDIPINQTEMPLVSVIVPNYNHAKYLKERLDSIYNQTYKNIEVILLDDASSDNSVNILNDYLNKHPHNTRIILNKENSGKVFLQWNKGLAAAKGEYIWIAESDDYCDNDFLEKLLIGLRHQSVMLSYARSVFMQNGKKVWTLEEYLDDLPISWDSPFIMSAHLLVNKAFAIKNIIPNVSSAVFRNVGLIPNEIIEIWKDMSLCGDWLFYLWLIRGGGVSYTNQVVNYYRIHPNSTSLKIQNTLDYYTETLRVSCFIAQKYAVKLSVFNTVKDNLTKHYLAHHPNGTENIERIYNLNLIEEYSKLRRPNIAICCYSLMQGGGEIFPIHLANELKKQDISITFIDFRGGVYDEGIRKMLNCSIPLIELSSAVYLNNIISSLGIEIIHTHEGSTDRTVAYALINKEQKCKHIITLHGMYEAISKKDLDGILEYVIPSCSCFVYIADKNLIPLRDFIESIRIKKIGNGLPEIPIFPHKRKNLGIDENSFCLTLVSRARMDKGWMEAIEAVNIANSKSKRPIHLILIGDGECYDILKSKQLPTYIHLLGRKSDVRNYFAMSDIGLLPSRFKGESFPLVVIESLMSGTPIIASDICEIRNMITDESGEMAGVLFKLNDWQIPIESLAQIITDLANDNIKYSQLKSRINSIVPRFNISYTAKQYMDVYYKELGYS